MLTLGLVLGSVPGASPIARALLLGWAFSAGVALLGTSGFMVFGSKVLKPRIVPELLLSKVALRGDEQVLDVGCGRGLVLIAAAKRLSTGRAIGVDIWRAEDQTGNRPEATWENAVIEGVGDRLEVKTGDARELPFKDGTFDVVLSSLVLHNIRKEEERRRAIREVVRVLRPGGRLAILDFQKVGEYARVLGESSMDNVAVSSSGFATLPPVRVVTATKPFGPRHEGSDALG